MTARIYRPAPNAMQSGRGKSKQWVLVHEPASAREIEPLMGYTATTDTQTQVRLSFETLEEAETYARSNGIPYTRAAGAYADAEARELSRQFPVRSQDALDALSACPSPPNSPA